MALAPAVATASTVVNSLPWQPGRKRQTLAVVLLAFASTAANPSNTIVFGCTCGLTGEYALPCRDVVDGLNIFQNTVNQRGIVAANGRRFFVNITVEDDKSDETTSKALYKKMAADENVVAFLGPYGSKTTRGAAEAVRDTCMVLLMHNAPLFDPVDIDDSTRNQKAASSCRGRRLLFSLSRPAHTNLIVSLDLLRAVAPYNISFASPLALQDSTKVDSLSETDAVAESACAAGMAYARNIGLNVIRIVSTGASSHFFTDLESISQDTEILVVCGSLRREVDLSIIARVRKTASKGVLLSQAANGNFVKTVGPAIASYVMAPVAWNSTDPAENDGVAFRSAKDFADHFLTTYNREASIESAEAVAAAQALIVASVYFLGRYVNPHPSEIARYLDDRDIPTVLGTLTWNSASHFVQSRTWSSVQLVPQQYREERDLFSRQRIMYRKLRLQAPQVLPIFPMLPVVMKELDDCPPGSERNGFDGETMHCSVCKPGQYRRKKDMLNCENCPLGFYAFGFGNSDCTKCEVGASCDEADRKQKHEVPDSSPGYYRVNRSPPTYMACASKARFCLRANKCGSHKIGMMCAFCEDGYSRNWGRSPAIRPEEMPCESCLNTHRLFPMIIVVSLCFVLICLIAAKRTAGNVPFGLVVARITIDHMQITAIISHSDRVHGSPFIRSMTGLFLRPFSIYLSDCLPKGIGYVEANLLVGWCVAPLIVLISFFTRSILHRGALLSLLRWWRLRRGRMKKDERSVVSKPSVHPDNDMFWVKHAVVGLYLLYPVIVWAHVQVLYCVFPARQVSEEQALYHQEYNSIGFGILSCVGFVLYAVCLPLAAHSWLVKTANTHHHLRTATSLRFLYGGLKNHSPWYFLTTQFKKTALMCIQLLPNCEFYMIICALASLLVELKFNCYKSEEMFVFKRLVFVARMFQALYVLINLLGTAEPQVQESIISYAPIFTWCLFFCGVAAAVFRSIVLKGLVFTEAAAPHVMSRASFIALRLLERHSNPIVYRMQDHGLLFAALNCTEVKLLSMTLRNLIHEYIDANVPFHAGYLVTAIRESFAVAIASRRIDATNLLRLCSNTSWKKRAKTILFDVHDCNTSPVLTTDNTREHRRNVNNYVENCIERYRMSGSKEPKTCYAYVQALTDLRVCMCRVEGAEGHNSLPVEHLHDAAHLVAMRDIRQRRPSLFAIDTAQRVSERNSARQTHLIDKMIQSLRTVIDGANFSVRTHDPRAEKFTEPSGKSMGDLLTAEHHEIVALSEEMDALRFAARGSRSAEDLFFLPSCDSTFRAYDDKVASIGIGGEHRCVPAPVCGGESAVSAAARTSIDSSGASAERGNTETDPIDVTSCTAEGGMSQVTAASYDSAATGFASSVGDASGIEPSVTCQETLSPKVCPQESHEEGSAFDVSDCVFLPPSQPCLGATAEAATRFPQPESLNKAISPRPGLLAQTDVLETTVEHDGDLIEESLTALGNHSVTTSQARMAAGIALLASSECVLEPKKWA